MVSAYSRLFDSGDGRNDVTVKKGYVPVLVGDEGSTEKFVVPLKLFKNPCMVELLEMAAEEYGYREQGILRIPCDTDHFRGIIDMISSL